MPSPNKSMVTYDNIFFLDILETKQKPSQIILKIIDKLHSSTIKKYLTMTADDLSSGHIYTK